MRDIIYRDDAIDAVRFDTFNTLNADERELEINRIPSAIAQDWIPISEGLPSDDDDVFVTVIDDHGDTPWRYTDVAWLCNGTWIADNEILFGNVIAWMPQRYPKPYKSDGE